MRFTTTVPVAFAAMLAAGASAQAAPLTAATILDDFNAVIYGNASTPSDIEGAAVVGGNFSGATVYNNPQATQPAGYGALTVYGSTSGNAINLDNGGSAAVGGTKGATINFNGGGGYTATTGSIAAFETPLNALSQSLSQLTPTGTLPSPTNNEVITATPNLAGIAVFDLTAAQLAAIPSFSLNLNGASTVVFNVDGSAATFNANDESGTNGADNIIWNFYDATGTVAFNTSIGGTVLAPGANVTNATQIDGALVAASWNGSGELHDFAFTGALPASGPTPVSEPASMALLAAGVLGLLIVRRGPGRRGSVRV